MQQKKREAEERRSAATATAAMKVKESTPGFTIRLGFGNDSPPAPKSAPVQAPNAPARASAAPRGVPTISKWRQNRDGSISGFISGSTSFDDGDAVTTSPIRGEVSGGIVVQTTSGSKYFLSPVEEKQRIFTLSLFGGGEPRITTPKPVPAQPSTSKADAKEAAAAKRVAALQAAQERKAAAKAKHQAAVAQRKEQKRRLAEKKAPAEAKRQETLAAARAEREKRQRIAEQKKAAAK